MTPTVYWDGWYEWLSAAAIVGYVVVTAGVVSGLAIWAWWQRE